VRALTPAGHRVLQPPSRVAAASSRAAKSGRRGGNSAAAPIRDEPDLFASGGVFIATYEKPPPLGADVRVSLRFPTGPSCELSGNVAWVRDQLGEDAPPGFGVRFAALSAEARELVQAYSEAREPMLYDD
jgi:hypothetical protein